jgi:antitoxin component YwqK of YwqJK toxin-antitoxin module
MLVGLSAGLAACSSSSSAEQSDEDIDRPSLSTERGDGRLIQRLDLDGDGDPDVVKYIEEYQSEDNSGVTKRRIRRKKVDVNRDGKFDIVKKYDKEGVPTRETVDADLDGTDDFVRYFEEGSLARKELFGDDGKTVRARRFYANDELTRVEKDTNADGQFDHWEYYKDGKLQRIGRDSNGDSEIDKWVYRE